MTEKSKTNWKSQHKKTFRTSRRSLRSKNKKNQKNAYIPRSNFFHIYTFKYRMTTFAKNLFQLMMYLEHMPFHIPNVNFSLMMIMKTKMIRNDLVMFLAKIWTVNKMMGNHPIRGYVNKYLLISYWSRIFFESRFWRLR